VPSQEGRTRFRLQGGKTEHPFFVAVNDEIDPGVAQIAHAVKKNDRML
jgi:hypothetical protein